MARKSAVVEERTCFQYVENIKRIEKLSESGIRLDEIKSIINDPKDYTYIDPDTGFHDELLYKSMGRYLGNSFEFLKSHRRYVLNNSNLKIEFGLDGVISFDKILKIVEEGYDVADEKAIVGDALDFYRRIRERCMGQLVFPCREVPTGKKTINTLRGLGLSDRVDYTLADIRNYLFREKSIMKAMENNVEAKRWLDSYIDEYDDDQKEERWKKIVKDMKWKDYLGKELEIIDYSNNKTIPSGKDWIEYFENNRKEPDMKYLKKLVSILEEKSKKLEEFCSCCEK